MNTGTIKEVNYVPGCIIQFNFDTPVRAMYVLNELAEIHGAHSHLIVNMHDGKVMMSFNSLERLKNNVCVYAQEVILPE